MARKRRNFSQEFKFKVALEALKGQATINEIAGRYQVHPNQVRNWKKKLTENGAAVFERKQNQQNQKDLEEKEAELYEQIGRLKMELEWLKKKVTEIN
jgi:putative transposase